MSKVTGKDKRRSRRKPKQGLRVIQPNVAGIDLGSREHYVCCPPTPEGEPNVQHFGTTTPELHRLADWLKEQGVKSVAMESTGVYWIPIYEILESRSFEVLLVNARAISRALCSPKGRLPAFSPALFSRPTNLSWSMALSLISFSSFNTQGNLNAELTIEHLDLQ